MLRSGRCRRSSSRRCRRARSGRGRVRCHAPPARTASSTSPARRRGGDVGDAGAVVRDDDRGAPVVLRRDGDGDPRPAGPPVCSATASTALSTRFPSTVMTSLAGAATGRAGRRCRPRARPRARGPARAWRAGRRRAPPGSRPGGRRRRRPCHAGSGASHPVDAGRPVPVDLVGRERIASSTRPSSSRATTVCSRFANSCVCDRSAR